MLYYQHRNTDNATVYTADILFSLLEQVIKRLAREGDGYLVRATLCLLEVSKSGLLETELLDLLGDEANLIRKRRTKDGIGKSHTEFFSSM